MRRSRIIAPLVVVVAAWSVSIPAFAAGAQETSGQQGEEQQRAEAEGHGDDASRITVEYIPLLVEGALTRPKPILELGTPFLGSGPIRRGFTMPGGAVW